MITNEIFIKNIESLRSEKNMRISDFEKEVGVGTGYFSRLEKTPNTLPGIEVLFKIVSMFDVSFDILLFCEIDGLNYNEKKLLDFFIRLRNETAHGSRKWEMIETNNLCYCSHVLLPEGGQFDREPETRYDGNPVASAISTDRQIELVPISIRNEEDNVKYFGVEVYFIDKDKKIPVCATNRVHKAVESKIFELTYIARSISCQPNISEQAINIIEDYMR